MVDGHSVGMDLISPSFAAESDASSRRPQRKVRSRTKNLLSASFRMKSKHTVEADALSECEVDEIPNWDQNDPFKPLELPTISSSMLAKISDDFEAGVKLREKKHPLRLRPDFLFSGSDAVTFLVDHGYAASRKIGVEIGRRLAYEFALFEHVTMDHDLEDKNDLFYRFTPLEKRQVVELCEEASSKGGEYNIDYIADVFEEGVEVGHNVYHYRSYKDTFVGRDAVSFLVNARLARTRQDAVRVGNLLFERGIFKHCCNDHPLKDKFLFYRFVPRKQRVQEQKPSLKDTMPVEALAMRFRELVKPSSDPHHPFKNTFCGSAAVDAIIKGRMASSRFEAVELGQKLASDLSLFFCVYDNDRPFMDNPHTYYQYYQHKTPSIHWLRKDDSHSERGTESIHDDELSQAGSLEDADLFDESPMSRTPKLVQTGNEDVTGDKDVCVHFDLEHDKPELISKPFVKMSAFNLSMRLLEEEDESSELGSVNTDNNASATDNFLLFEESARYFDKYGFVVDRETEKGKNAPDSALHKKYIGCDLSSEEWGVLLDECSSAATELSKASLTKIKHAMRLGLSDCHRQRAWTIITGVDILMPEKAGDYENLVKLGFRCRSNSIGGVSRSYGQTLRGVIERDLHRTFPKHILFCGSDGVMNDEDVSDEKFPCTNVPSEEPPHKISHRGSPTSASSDLMSPSHHMSDSSGPAALRRILYAYSVYDSEVGYCQGMNFIAAMFLTFLPEEESFWMLVAVMNEEPYDMRNMFLESMAGAHKSLYIVDKLIKKYLPKLSRYFLRENIEVSMFATQWIMTVFTSTFSFELVARVWDSFLVEGWKVVYRVILALLNHASSDLMELTMEEIFDYFRDLSSKVDGHAIILASLNIPLKNKQLRKYGEEWERLQVGGPVGRRNSMESNASSGTSNTNSNQKIRLPKKIVPSFVHNKLPFRS
ncbi:hypothetical protein HJC23_004037 [Cyclotella cryptica]|uniref:Rab-GAP TBC domain-containing protein n=1 Tax=Cyclotella cryptica TaxID=29204 RepID=A0ABD3QU36_9STRA|eukprot:CCRYP_002039-RA/>CCRYP_002039-RA protein AED:0.03 eAED:0.03 QI:385/1/1/1/0.66/0.5/4/281/937